MNPLHSNPDPSCLFFFARTLPGHDPALVIHVHKPCCGQGPRLSRLLELEFKLAKQLWEYFVDFEKADVLANASAGPASELRIVSLCQKG